MAGVGQYNPFHVRATLEGLNMPRGRTEVVIERLQKAL
jgi:hypothetical protein